MADTAVPNDIYRARKETKDALLPGLRGWQIFFLLASVVIGEGIFSGDREALEVAGPAGTLIALFLVGLLAITVMGSVSELVQLFPVPNAIVRYIQAFVDEDLAWCCGIAYWYTWTTVFVALYYTAANLTAYWQWQSLWHNVIFVISPLVIFGINVISVDLFGIVETIGGILKIMLVIGVAIAMYCLHSEPAFSADTSPLYDGIEAKPGIVPNDSKFAAILYIIPIIAFSLLGVESITVMAFEACDVQSLRYPSRFIAWFILAIYLFCLIAELLVFSWTDPNLPEIYQSNNVPSGSKSGKAVMAVVAAEKAGHPTLATWINIGCVYSALSASTSALYIASRTLYGLARDQRHHDTAWSKIFASVGRTTQGTRVPVLAIFCSMIVFVWLPFFSNLGDSVELLFGILLTTSSVMCLIVWAFLCLALLRFRWWFELCRDQIGPGYERFDHAAGRPDGASTGLMFLQPWLALIGFVTSLLVVIVLAGAPMWVEPTGQKFAINYIAPLVILILWLARKLWFRRTNPEHKWYVEISSDPNPLMDTLKKLQCEIPLKSSMGWPEFKEQHPWARRLERVLPGLTPSNTSKPNVPTTDDPGIEAGQAASHQDGRYIEMMHSPSPAERARPIHVLPNGTAGSGGGGIRGAYQDYRDRPLPERPDAAAASWSGERIPEHDHRHGSLAAAPSSEDDVYFAAHQAALTATPPSRFDGVVPQQAMFPSPTENSRLWR